MSSVEQVVSVVNDDPEVAVNPKTAISRARRLAKRHHLRLVKDRSGSPNDSLYGYQLQAVVPVHGLEFELSIEDVTKILAGAA